MVPNIQHNNKIVERDLIKVSENSYSRYIFEMSEMRWWVDRSRTDGIHHDHEVYLEET